MAHEGSLAGYTFPLPILLKPYVGEAAGSYNRISFRLYALAVCPGNDGNVAVKMNFYPTVA